MDEHTANTQEKKRGRKEQPKDRESVRRTPKREKSKKTHLSTQVIKGEKEKQRGPK